MVAQPELTYDIWELVTDILADEMIITHPETAKPLKALSLTCTAMVPLCQKQLFATLLLSDGPSSPIEFRNLISDNPGIVQYIRHLEYYMYTPFSHHILQIFDALTTGSSALQSIYLNAAYKPWDTFPTSWKASFEQLVHLPTVTRISLQSLKKFPLHILGGCSNLVDLTLQEMDFTPDDDFRSSPTSSLVLLDGVHTRSPQGPDNDQRPVEFIGLKTLYTLYYTENREVVWGLLQTTPALEYLELITFDILGVVGLADALLTHTIPTLKQLLVFTWIWEVDNTPLCEFIAELATIAGTNVLEEISLHIAFSQDVTSPPDTEDWEVLDSLLTESGSFPRLKSASVVISWDTTEGGESEPVILNRITGRNFPLLSESDTVEFRFSAENKYLSALDGQTPYVLEI